MHVARPIEFRATAPTASSVCVVAVFFWFSACFVDRVVIDRAAFLACSPACLSLRSSFDRQLHITSVGQTTDLVTRLCSRLVIFHQVARKVCHVLAPAHVRINESRIPLIVFTQYPLGLLYTSLDYKPS